MNAEQNPYMSPDRDRRERYRAGQSPSEPLEARVHLPTGEAVPAEFHDLSASGASLRTLLERAHLSEGDVVELEVGAAGRAAVRTPAKVVFAGQDGERHVRYGFEFINLGNLYAQLDEFYARWFNRRRSLRGPAELDVRTPVRLSWRGHFLEAAINELSLSGMGLLLSREQAALLEEVGEVEAAFQLPGCALMSGTARVRHRTHLSSRVLVGLRFDLDAPVGFSRHQQALGAYLLERDRRIESWASSWA